MSTLGLLLRESWSFVEGAADEVAHQLYARMFVADPGLRELFPIEMSAQRAAFLRTLVNMITVEDPAVFDAIVRDLGRDHRTFHVEPSQYDTMGVALVETLRAFAGNRWRPEFDRAWREAYQRVADTMRAGADGDAHRPACWPADVVTHERRDEDLAVFACRPLAPFPYAAGQHTSIEIHHYPRLWRTYSIANAPRGDGVVEFHVRARAATGVSAALVRRLRIGDVIRLGSARGTMTLLPQSTRDIVCVAGGTGYAPIKALLEQLGQENTTRWVYVFLGARKRQGLYDLAALNRFAARHPWLSVVAACSEEPGYPGDRGPVNEVVERYGPWSDHEFYVAGPPAMVRATRATLSRLRVSPGLVRYDAVPGPP